MPVYSLYLNNFNPQGNVFSKNFGYTSCTWLVDFDNLFKGENYKYSKCRIRFKMVSKTDNALQSFFSSINLICCSLPSVYCSNALFPTILNVLALQDSNVAITPKTVIPQTNTVETTGVNIAVPKGSFPLTIALAKSTNINDYSTLVSTTTIINYNIHLQFELYD